MRLIYETQRNTGDYSKFNCGPSVTKMACNRNGIESPSIEEIRSVMGGRTLWNDSVLSKALERYNITFDYVSSEKDPFFWKSVLDKNKIIIANPNMWDFNKSNPIGKPYKTYHRWWGHYLIVNMYNLVKFDTFNVLDPYTPEYALGREYDIVSFINVTRHHNPNIFII